MQTATVLVDKSEYRPSEDEPFMNDRQLEYFKNKLLAWKEEINEAGKSSMGSTDTGGGSWHFVTG